MTDDLIANIITVIMVMVGMWLAVVFGYYLGYNDAKKHLGAKK